MIKRKQLVNAMKGICACCDQCYVGQIARTSTKLSLSVTLNRNPKMVTSVRSCPKFEQHYALFSGDITL